MAPKVKKTASKKSAKASKPAVVVDQSDDVTEDEGTEEATTGNTGLDRVISRSTVQPNWQAFSDFIVENGGPKINPKHVGVVLTGYKYFQKSDAAVTAREQSAAEKAEAKAEREAAREQRARDAAAKKAEREEARAAREAKAQEKATATKKTAAAASKPKATKAAKAAPVAKAGKKTAAKKTSGKKAKAAF